MQANPTRDTGAIDHRDVMDASDQAVSARSESNPSNRQALLPLISAGEIERTEGYERILSMSAQPGITQSQRLPSVSPLQRDDAVSVVSLPEQKIIFDKPFPLALRPTSNVRAMNFVELQEYISRHRAEILSAVSEHGAVMFCGFDLRSAEEWASVLNALGLQQVEYTGGAAVRKLVVGNEQRMPGLQVLTTNESPSHRPIPFHNELAQTPNPPSHICFYCETAPTEGGATPLYRSDDLYLWLKENCPEMLEKFEQHGVEYVRIVPEEDDPSSALGRSWKSMFHVNNREEAEAAMSAEGWRWEWLDQGECKTITKALPAVRVASNGNPSFYNQVVAAYTGWVDSRNDPKKAVCFGDGTPLPEKEMDKLVDYLDKNQCVIPWQSGQFVIVDNSVACHSREPFTGKRVVYAAIADGTKEVDNPAHPTHLVLSSGDKMPAVGFGLWKVAQAQCADVVHSAIKEGYRCFDSAADYDNEKQVGEGLARAFEQGIVDRSAVWVTSKLWNTFHEPHRVEEACRRSLDDLQLDYLDLYMVHFPISLKYVDQETRYPPGWFNDPNKPEEGMIEEPVPLHKTWEAMEALVEKGLVRNIGLCNVGVSQLRDIMAGAKVKPSALQVELHPHNSQPALLRFCREKGIAVTGFSNLGSGSYVSIGMAGGHESCLDEPIIKAIAQAKGKTPAQVVLRWGVQRGAAVIPKSTRALRQRENLDLYDFKLDVSQMQAIDELNKERRFNDPGQFCEEAFNTFYPIYE